MNLTLGDEHHARSVSECSVSRHPSSMYVTGAEASDLRWCLIALWQYSGQSQAPMSGSMIILCHHRSYS